MLNKTLALIITTALLLNINVNILLADVVQQCTLRMQTTSGTKVEDELIRSVADNTWLEARYSYSAMARRIADFISPERQGLLISYRNADTEGVNVYLDALNARRTLKHLDELEVAPMFYVEDYQDDNLSIENLLKGKLAINMPFSGIGSRNLNSIRALGITKEQISDEALRLANVDVWQVVKEMGLIDEIQEHAIRIGLAERHMLALEQGILNLKKSHNLNDREIALIMAGLKLTIDVFSDDIRDDIHRIFLSPSKLSGKTFFGFNPKNIIFIEGGYGTGYELSEKGRPFPSQTRKKVSWNHGYAFIEQAWLESPQAYTLTGQLNMYTHRPITIGLDKPVFDYVLERGAEYGCVHRINDLILLHPDMALDVQMFGAFLNLVSRNGINAYFEMVANPTMQKGGMALTTDGEYLKVLESLATRDVRIQERLDEITQEQMQKTAGRMGVPYARLYGYYIIRETRGALLAEDMELHVDYDGVAFSPEIPIQDITWLKGIKAIAGLRRRDRLIEECLAVNEQRDRNNNPILDESGKPKPAYLPEDGGSGAVIHDCKEAKNYPDALMLISALDDPARGIFEPEYYLSARLIEQTEMPNRIPISGRALRPELIEAINIAA